MTRPNRRRDLEITRAVVDGGSLRGLGIMYGISHERARMVYVRTIREIAETFDERVPTIHQIRAEPRLWRGRIEIELHLLGGDDGNT